MKRNVVTLIIVLLSLCLTGIICFQIYWFTKAYSVKEEQFDRSVFNAMNNIADKLETYETLSSVSTKIDFDESDENDNDEKIHNFSFNKFLDDSLFESLDELNYLDDSIENALNQIHHGNFQISISADDDSAKVQINNNSVKVVVKNKKDSGQFVIDNNKEKKALMKSKIKDRKKWISKLIKKMIVNIETKDFPIEKRIEHNSIESLIKNELINNGISLHFEYGVAGPDPNNISIKSEGFKSKMILSKYKIHLFQKDIVQRTEMLVLDFPKKKKYIMSTLSLSMFVQILFTIIIIMVFAGTIFFIIKQKRISDMKNDFINNMTHEFKTPIATINLAVDSINNPKVLDNTDMIQNFTRIIKEENNRMNDQVENILQISMLDKQELTLNKKIINVHELIEVAINKLKLQVESRGGKINFEFNAEKYNIEGDSIHFTNAMINIIDNANKYSPENPQIFINTKNSISSQVGENDTIIISIKDYGIGMSNDVQQKIFDKFYRATSGNIHNVKGFGLGLYYVKAIIDAHKGQMKVKSELEKGSTFEIILPLLTTNSQYPIANS